MVRNVDHDQGEDQLFANLRALLPDLPSEADKSTIVDAAVKEIKNMEQIVETLEKKKQEKLKSIFPFPSESSFVMNSTLNSYESRKTSKVDQGSSTSNPLTFQTWSSQNVVLNIYRDKAQFCICAIEKPGLLTKIAIVLEKHMIDVVYANITCNGNKILYMIQVHARQGLYEANSMEETFKQAAREIMTWIS